jgi:CubicO group peptidase (beta-lactamase class C family)
MIKQFRKIISLCFIVLLVAEMQTLAQTQADFTSLDPTIEQIMKEWKVPGLAIAVVKEGKIVYAKGYGFRDVKKGLKVTPDTLFAIGSCSKAFTAAALGILADEGKIEWDKPVREYLPSFKLADEYATANLRVRDLVTHQSGLPRHDLVWYGSSLSRKEIFDRLRYLEPSKPLHAKYQYNNLMFMTAGLLVGEVSKSSWEDYTRKNILDPLGMKTSNFSVNESQKFSDFALPYGEMNGEVKEIAFRNIDEIGPAGSINSSVNEMANWLTMQMSKGKFNSKQIISEANLRENQTPQIVTGGGELRYDELFYSSYGMGWGVTSYRGHLTLAHSGGIDGFISQVRVLPKDKLGVVILTNSGTNASAVLMNIVLDKALGLSDTPWIARAKDDQAKAKEVAAKAKAKAEEERKTGTQPSHPLREYTGTFEHPAYQTLTVTQEGERLHFDLHGLKGTLKHYHYDVFQCDKTPDGMSGAEFDGLKVSFLMNSRGDIDRLTIKLEASVKEIVFTRKDCQCAGR